jgi:hypothetical protein
MDVIDIAGWALDEQFSPYPEGSRDKYALIAPDGGCPDGIIPGHRYLMKFSNQRYPIQFWSEVIATFVGQHVGVPTPPAFIAVDPRSGQPGSLIEWFYGPKLEHQTTLRRTSGFSIANAFRALFASKEEVPKTHSLYVPGSNYMVRVIPEYDLKSGTQHNLLDVGIWIQTLGRISGQDFWPYWGKMLLFDALIGNTDRHQDNWGVLWRADEAGNPIPRFAPAFDNGTSLAHEVMEDRLNRFSEAAAVDRYVRRGRHHLRWARSDPKPCAHFELIERLIRARSRLREPIKQVLDLDYDSLFAKIAHLTTVDAPVPLRPERADLICRMIDRRLTVFKEIFP